MLSRKTLLILGAGASAPFGYPTGMDLRQYLTKHAMFSSEQAFDDIRLDTEARSREFAQLFRDSRIASVDSFLSLNPGLAETGKIALVAALLFFESKSTNTLLESNINGDWLGYLWNRIRPRKAELLRDIPLSILTFNYDRLVEHYLYTSITSSFREDAAAQDQLRTTPTAFAPLLDAHHVYGQYANLPWQEPDTVFSYGSASNPARSPRRWSHYAENIRVIGDRTGPNADAIGERIRDAETIFFLGFGFDEQNVDLIRPHLDASRQKIYGTVLGLSPREIATIYSYFETIGFPRGHRIMLEATDCLGILREHFGE